MEPIGTMLAHHHYKKQNQSHEARQRRSHRRKYAAVFAAGVVLTGAVAHWLDSSSGSQITRGSKVTQATVFHMQAETIDCRARTSAAIESDAWIGLNLHVPKTGSGIPLVGSVFGGAESAINAVLNVENHTMRFDTQFRSPDGKGGGQVDTLTCAQASAMKVVPEGNKQVITIPTQAIEFESYVVEDQSKTLPSYGVGASTGKFEWDIAPKFLTGDLTRQIDVGVAETEVAAREVAVNYAQQQCQVAAWKETKQVFLDAEREIGYEEYLQARQYNKQLTFNPYDITVEFTGPAPIPPAEYTIPRGFHTSNTLHNQCVVDSNAYQPPIYMSPNGQVANPSQFNS